MADPDVLEALEGEHPYLIEGGDEIYESDLLTEHDVNANMPVKEEYWAAGEPDQIIGHINMILEQEGEEFYLQNKIIAHARISGDYFYGELHGEGNPGDTAIVAMGPNGEELSFSANLYKALGMQALGMVTAEPPNLEAFASTNTSNSLLQARLASRIIESYQSRGGVHSELTETLKQSLIYGTGFVSVTWDTTKGEFKEVPTGEVGEDGQPELTYNPDGDVLVEMIPFCDVVWDFRRKCRPDKLEWIAYRTREDKYDLVARFPEVADDILNVDTDELPSDSILDGEDEIDLSDDVEVWHFYHRPNYAMPQGRWLRATQSGHVLVDGVNPYGKLPVRLISPQKVANSVVGWSPLFDIQKQQEMVSTLYAKVASRFDLLGDVVIWSDSTAGAFGLQNYTGGPRFVHGERPAQVLNLSEVPQEFFTWLERTAQDMERVMGLSSVAAGFSAPGVRSGKQQQFAHDAAMEASSPLEAAWYELYDGVMEDILELVKEHSPPEKVLKLAHSSHEASQIAFDSQQIEDVVSVDVKRTPAITKSVMGRIELVNLLAQNGVPIDIDQVLNIVQGAPLESVTGRAQGQLDKAKIEAEMLIADPSYKHAPLVTDDHVTHILQKAALLNDPRAPEDITARVLAAIEQHIFMLFDQTNPIVPMLQAVLGYSEEALALMSGGGEDDGSGEGS